MERSRIFQILWSWSQTLLVHKVCFLSPVLPTLGGWGEQVWVGSLGLPIALPGKVPRAPLCVLPSYVSCNRLGQCVFSLSCHLWPLTEKGQWSGRNGELAVLTCVSDCEWTWCWGRASGSCVSASWHTPRPALPERDLLAGEDQGLVPFLRIGSVWILEECPCVLSAGGRSVTPGRCVSRKCLQNAWRG